MITEKHVNNKKVRFATGELKKNIITFHYNFKNSGGGFNQESENSDIEKYGVVYNEPFGEFLLDNANTTTDKYMCFASDISNTDILLLKEILNKGSIDFTYKDELYRSLLIKRTDYNKNVYQIDCYKIEVTL